MPDPRQTRSDHTRQPDGDDNPRGGLPDCDIDPGGWVILRLTGEQRAHVLDALQVAADWMLGDLECADCNNGTCHNDLHTFHLAQVLDWRALSAYVAATPLQPAPPAG